MAGLLDMLGGYQDESAPASGGLDDPRIQGLLTAGLAMLGSRGNFAQALSEGGLAGLQSMQQGKQFAQASAMRDMQLQQQRDAIEAQKRRQAWIASIPSPQMGAAQAALGGGGGPTVANAQKMQPVDPMAQLMHGAMQAGVVPPEVWLQSQQKDNSPMVVKEGETLLDKRTLKPLFSNPKNDEPSEVKEYRFAQQQGYPGTFQQFVLEKRRAGATSVNVSTDNLGLKPKDRFEMEGKLASDYDNSVKTDSAVLAATGKIRAAFTQSGALKDQAAIYAFAKMLDPDGAVREADYAAISGSAGLIDRARNYAQKLLNGEQLTPTQRAEMIAISDAFDKVAKRRIAAQRERFTQQAQRYNLRPDAVLSPQAPQPIGSGEWGIEKVN